MVDKMENTDDLTVDISEEEVISQQVFAISRLTPAMMMANIVNVIAVVLVLQIAGQNRPVAVVWALVVSVFALYFLWKWFRRRAMPFPKKLSRRTRTKTTMFAAVLGFLWAFPGLVLIPDTSGPAQAFLIALAAGMVAGGAISLYPIPSAALAFSSIVVAGNLFGFALTGQLVFVGFAIVTVAFMYVIARAILRHEQIFVSEFRNRRKLVEKSQVVERLLNETRASAIEERLASEAKLAQAQKMEAVGRLTAGVAHDFNNLLGVIMGNLELLQDDIHDEDQRQLIRNGLEATLRGADLTRSMLAFARKAPLNPKVLDLNDVVRRAKNWVGRTIPERIEIELSLLAGLWKTEADEAATINVLLNLILNACDAMVDNGKITIETANVRVDDDYVDSRHEDIETGRYVMVAVSDTGTGIAPEKFERIFEPFYTTKPPGAGSGLGLAMIMGFMKQSNGFVRVYSEPGCGTTFKLYFRTSHDALAVGYRSAKKSSEPATGTGRILVVEDEPEVLANLEAVLTKAGYQIQTACNGDTAAKIFATDTGFDLLLTDIVMPGELQGTTLSRVLRETRPDLPIVFMTGYASEATVHGNGLHPEDIRLMKPVRRSDLLAAIQKSITKPRM